MHLVDRANNVLHLILSEPKLRQGDISFVAHSFGGLILQQVLRTASDRAATEPLAGDFINRVSRIVFLGTPHRGAELATWASLLRLIVRPSAATQGLIRNDPNLRDLNHWFRQFALANSLEIRTLVESRKTFVFWIVPPDSADPGLLSEPIPLDEDHFGIASPASKDSQSYRLVKTFLESSPPRNRVTAKEDVLKDIATNSAATAATLERLERRLTTNTFVATAVPLHLVDGETDNRLLRVRKSRFFVGASYLEDTARIATDLFSGELSAASVAAKARATAWCARLLFTAADQSQAFELVSAARRLASLEEVSIAEAFARSHKNDFDGALAQLSQLKSPTARSASFMIVRNKSGSVKALEWLEQAGISFDSLDGDGKFLAMLAELELQRFEDAIKHAEAVQPQDFADTPALFFSAATAHLVRALPVEVASAALSQPAFALLTFPFADDRQSLEHRRKAADLYAQAALNAAALGCADASYEASDKALLLDLLDPDRRGEALVELEQSMRSEALSLRRLPLALQFGLKLDLARVEVEIDREVVRSAGTSADAAFARFAIAKSKKPKEALEYIEAHRDELSKHLKLPFLQAVEIELLVRSGEIQTAEERLLSLKAKLGPEDYGRIAAIVAAGKHSDPLAFREQQFIETDSLPDLVILVEHLEREKDLARLAKYGGILFGRTKDFSTFHLYCMALYETGQFGPLVEVLRSNSDFVSRSEALRSIFAWSLYNLGQLVECRVILSELRTVRDNADDRNLVVSLSVTSGDWNSLASFVEREWEQRADRSPQELLRAAQIASQLGSSRGRDLLVEAAADANDNAEVLLGCYSIAMQEGAEDQVSYRWLERAAELSDENGPVQRYSLREVLDLQPDWQRRENQAWEQYHAGEIPIVALARLVNRSVIELGLLPALGNSLTIDPRRRMLIYSYSGVRRSVATTTKTIAIDPTALLNAGMLGLLNRIVEAVDKVVIPHSTLSWLFEEKQRIHFHQPSKVADAQELKRLIDADVLKRFEPTITVDETLAVEVGDELATLFAEAEADWGDARPRKVVRSRPIHRVASLMEEEADLSTHVDTVAGCLDLIDALVRQGRLTQVEEQRARAFLRLHETAWDGAPTVLPGSVLYMDSVALAYFQHLDLLSKFEASGFTVMIAASQLISAERIVKYEALTERAQKVIEDIRATLAGGLASGKIVVAPRLAKNEANAAHHPAIDIIRVCNLADCVLIDDRYFNQLQNIEHTGDARTPVTTTFDWLLNLKNLAAEEHADLVARIRSAALTFVPVTQEELEALLARAMVKDGALVETAELRALRENLQLCRMSIGLQLPTESWWFDATLRALIDSLKAQWRNDVGIDIATARSNWLLRLLDIRGWAHRYTNEQNKGVSRLRFVGMLKTLMLVNKDAALASKRAYWAWLETELLETVRERDSSLYTGLIDDLTHLIENLVERHGKAGEDVD